MGGGAEIPAGRIADDVQRVGVSNQPVENIATKVEPTDPYRSIGEIESEGLELEAVGQLTDNLRLQASYTYNDIRYTKSSAEEQGKRAVYAPRNQASARLSYDVKSGPLNGLTVGSGVRYVNGITSDRQNTHTLPSYTLVDMAVGYDLTQVGLKGLSAQVTVNNLTDKRYIAACNSLSLTAILALSVTLLAVSPTRSDAFAARFDAGLFSVHYFLQPCCFFVISILDAGSGLKNKIRI